MNECIPNATMAVIESKKLVDYALNPNHPVGRHKARVFASVLGFMQQNAGDLILQIRAGVQNIPAVPGRFDEYGRRYTVDIPVVGPLGSGVVRTGWIIDAGSTTPRLTTALVQ